MAIAAFPPVEHADKHGLLAVGGDLEEASLLLAYRSGIFPWPLDGETLAWFAPPFRTVLFLDEFHVAKTLQKERKRTQFSFAFDRNFEHVIRACASMENRGDQSGTWITDEIVQAYCMMQRRGHAHSVECYFENELVGGLYGMAIGGFFAGESMFYRMSNASKLCLVYLVEHLRERGVPWIDCQVMTPLFKSFGAREIPRAEYMRMLPEAINRKIDLF